MKNKNIKISGPVFSLITPFTSSGNIDYKSYFKCIDFYYSQGVRVFYLMLYNSRLGVLDEKETHVLNYKTANFLKKKYNNTIFIGAEKFEGSAEETISRINKLSKYPINMFSIIFGEKYYNDDQLYSHFKYINNKTKIPLLLHLQKMMSGFGGEPPVLNYSLSVTKKICKLKNFVAIKEDAKEINFTKKLIKEIKKDVSIIRSGGGMSVWKNFKSLGCQAWLVGIELLDPALAFDFLQALKLKDKYFIKNLEEKIETPFFNEVKKYGWHLFIKSCLEDCGIMQRDERLPMKALSSQKNKAIKLFMNKLRNDSKKYLGKKYFSKRKIF